MKKADLVKELKELVEWVKEASEEDKEDFNKGIYFACGWLSEAFNLTEEEREKIRG